MKVGAQLSCLQLETLFFFFSLLKKTLFCFLSFCCPLPQIHCRVSFATFTDILYPILWMIVYCYFLFIADILFSFCFVLMMETLWVLPRSILMPWMRAGDLPPGGNVVRFFSRWPFTSWILCFLNSFWGRNALWQGIKLNTMHKLKWGCLFFPFLFFFFFSFFFEIPNSHLHFPLFVCRIFNIDVFYPKE